MKRFVSADDFGQVLYRKFTLKNSEQIQKILRLQMRIQVPRISVVSNLLGSD